MQRSRGAQLAQLSYVSCRSPCCLLRELLDPAGLPGHRDGVVDGAHPVDHLQSPATGPSSRVHRTTPAPKKPPLSARRTAAAGASAAHQLQAVGSSAARAQVPLPHPAAAARQDPGRAAGHPGAQVAAAGARLLPQPGLPALRWRGSGAVGREPLPHPLAALPKSGPVAVARLISAAATCQPPPPGSGRTGLRRSKRGSEENKGESRAQLPGRLQRSLAPRIGHRCRSTALSSSEPPPPWPAASSVAPGRGPASPPPYSWLITRQSVGSQESGA